MNVSRDLGWKCRSSGNGTGLDDETFPAAEKILSDIENVVKKDEQLVSFEIIPVEDDENKSPVYHEEHSLGLASWCVPLLYRYVYGRLLDCRRSASRLVKEASKVTRWLMGALLLNPDVTTFWNMRRELVHSERLEVEEELDFSTIVLYHQAKCFETFAYKRWLLERPGLTGENLERSLRKELAVTRGAADRYANNYHAWNHRRYLIERWKKIAPESYGDLLRQEWEDSGDWCGRHVSDHSGLTYRQFLLHRLVMERPSGSSPCPDALLRKRRRFIELLLEKINDKSDEALAEEDSWSFLNRLHECRPRRRNVVDYKVELVGLSYWAEDCSGNERDIVRFPGHEALWYHRRFLGYLLLVIDDSYVQYSCYLDAPPERAHVGLLTLAFRRSNERIKISSSTDDSRKLAEKFLDCVRRYRFDVTRDRDDDPDVYG